MHQLQPTIKDGGRQNQGSQEHHTKTKRQLPSADELLADAGTLQVLREYFPKFRKLGAVFQTQNSKRVNIYWHGGLYLVKDFSGKEFSDDTARNVLQVLQFYHNYDFREALALLAAKLGHGPATDFVPKGQPVPRPSVLADNTKDRTTTGDITEHIQNNQP